MAKNVVWTNPVNMLARSVVSVPEGVGTQGLPVLYLFHGIGDTPAIWWSASGQVPILLAAATRARTGPPEEPGRLKAAPTSH